MDRDYNRSERKPGEVVGFRVGRSLRSRFYPGHILWIQNPGLQAGTIQEESDLPRGIGKQGGRFREVFQFNEFSLAVKTSCLSPEEETYVIIKQSYLEQYGATECDMWGLFQ